MRRLHTTHRHTCNAGLQYSHAYPNTGSGYEKEASGVFQQETPDLRYVVASTFQPVRLVLVS
jgi:hypothetical protein